MVVTRRAARPAARSIAGPRGVAIRPPAVPRTIESGAAPPAVRALCVEDAAAARGERRGVTRRLALRAPPPLDRSVAAPPRVSRWAPGRWAGGWRVAAAPAVACRAALNAVARSPRSRSRRARAIAATRAFAAAVRSRDGPACAPLSEIGSAAVKPRVCATCTPRRLGRVKVPAGSPRTRVAPPAVAAAAAAATVVER